MSFILSWRAGRLAGKAARIYRDITGWPPSDVDAKYLQDAAYWADDEKSLAFEILLGRLRYNEISPDGKMVAQYMSPSNPLAQRIINSLTWMVENDKITDRQKREFKSILSEMRGVK